MPKAQVRITDVEVMVEDDKTPYADLLNQAATYAIGIFNDHYAKFIPTDEEDEDKETGIPKEDKTIKPDVSIGGMIQ